MDSIEPESLIEICRTLENEAKAWLGRESETLPIVGRQVLFSADMRYVGQGYDVTVALERSWLLDADSSSIADAFHVAHRLAYGHAEEDNDIWLKEVRVHVVGETPKPHYAPLPSGTGVAPASQRDIRINGRVHKAQLYQRHALGAGDRLMGPAIIDQLDTTTLLPPNWTATMTASGTLILEEQVKVVPGL